MKNLAICIKSPARRYYRHAKDGTIDSVDFKVGEVHEVATPDKDTVIVNGAIISLSDQNFCFVINAPDDMAAHRICNFINMWT